MSVSGIGSGGGFEVSKMASTIASKVVKNLDANGDGSLDKKEFITGLTAKGVSADDAEKQFDRIDTKKTGTITQADLESDIKNTIGKGGPPPGGKGGPPPSGGPTGASTAGGAGQANGSASTNSAKTYDKADANKDGTVTSMEALVYQLKHPAVAPSDNNAATQRLGGNVDVQA